GAVVSGTLLTVTVTAEEAAAFPAASRARAVRVCDPLAAAVLSQVTAYGAAVSSAPRVAPSSRNCTPATPTLSEALAETVTGPETVSPSAGAVSDTAGAVVSETTGVFMSVWIWAAVRALL